MGEWQNEDDIKAELRTLTAELRQLRQELRSMLTPSKPSRARALLYRQSWPQPNQVPANEPVAEAADSGRKDVSRPQKK